METNQTEIQNLRRYSAAHNTALADILAEHINTNFSGVELVFKPVHIITPNKAQHNWLKEQLAQKNGFIGNLKQHSLNSFFRELIGELDPKRKDSCGKEELIWKLFSEMGKQDFRRKFIKIKEYCGDDEIKRLALAQQVAGLFEKYQEYDPQQDWKKQQHPDLEWQTWLYEETGYEEQLLSGSDLRELINKHPDRLLKFHSLYLLGDLQISPLHLEYLQVLAEREDFPMYVYSTHSAIARKVNPLAQSWGEYLVHRNKQLEELKATAEELSATTDVPENKLQHLQRDILRDSVSETLPQDDSILIYNSFTRVREVEALYNYLVRQVSNNKELGARDIMVCMPSLDPYVSAIRTVFDSAPYKFPYTLVSRGYGREESFWTALEQLLSFEREDLTAPGVFNLLETQPVQNSFGFSDLELLRKAFIDANIRREYEGDETLETHYASFRNGLSRLIYGFCLGDMEPVEICGKKVWPVDIAEGQQAQDLFRLHGMVEMLNDFLQLKQETKTAKEWHLELMKLSEDFLRPEDWQQRQFQELMESMGGIQASEEKIGFRTFFFRLKDQLHNKDLQQIKGRGGIVFCGLYSGMSMPKKLVAFLGLNFGEFPRKSQELSFDLLQKESKPNSRREDRGAFLETFLNAGQQVLLSYIGQDVKDNSVIPPSALISELQDTAEKAGAKMREVKHPLHAFNSRYFEDGEKDLYTYLGKTNQQVYLKCGIENTLELPKEVSIHALESFLKDPFRHHYNHALKIRYTDKEGLPDWELFDLNNLENWAVKDHCLKNQFASPPLDPEELRQEFLQLGKLPLMSFGKISLEEAEERVGFLWQRLEELEKDPQVTEEDIFLEFTLRGNHTVHLKGKVQQVAGEGLLLNVSKRRKDYEITAFVRYLVLLASGKARTLNYIHLNDDQSGAELVRVSNDWSQEKAYGFLKDWLQDLMSNYSAIIPFSAKFGFEVDEIALLAEDVAGPEKVKPKINKKFGRYGNCYPSPYLQREYDSGFFEEEENLVSFLHKYRQYMKPVSQAFN
ncbi:MAG: exodeoxyribonuclease V subunit gamma [Gillisia sp.]